MKRGDIVILAPPARFNKPRPALVVQAHVYEETENVTVALITSDLLRSPGIRIRMTPTAENGLRKASEIMVDHLQTVPVGRIGGVVGVAEPETMRQVGIALRLFLNV